jgi:hypothetical protein
MLILKLCQIPQARYIPKPEITREFYPKSKEKGIWDVLGFYELQKEELQFVIKIFKKR